MNMEQLVKELARGKEALGKNSPQCLFVHHKSHMT
jgi:hypothetical protein